MNDTFKSLYDQAPGPDAAQDHSGLPLAFVLPESLGGGQLHPVVIDGEPWLLASEVAQVLEYSHVPNMVRMLQEDEKGVHQVNRTSAGGNPNVTIISESGFYRIIMRSDRPQAEPFRRWVVAEVLPAIRRDGFYSGAAKMDEHLRTATGGELGLDSASPAQQPLPGAFGAILASLLPLLLPLLPALLAAVTAWLQRQSQPQAKALPEYMAEPWFVILQAVCMEHPRVDVARSLGVSAPFLSQVLNGSGKYGRGEASTHKLAEKVRRKFCHLQNHSGRPHHGAAPGRKTTVVVEH